MVHSRRRLLEIKSKKGIDLQQLFVKTLDKLLKYKSENISMQEKINSLQVIIVIQWL